MRLIFLIFFAATATAGAGEWLLSGVNTNALMWGRKGGLVFSIPPDGFRVPEPRGLIRLGYPVHANGNYDLVNFIAIEPVVAGKKGFSELERSVLDSRKGKRLSVLRKATISTIGGVEELSVKINVEKFENGAEVEVEILQRSDAPDEIRLITRALTNSAAMDFCILTATMGNMIRARELWLKDEVIKSLERYPDLTTDKFARHSKFPLERLLKLGNGDLVVAITTNEKEPAVTQPFPKSNFWHYTGEPVTQYWKKRAGTFREDLKAVVNARYMYWGSQRPIPGGVSFENFELNEKFYDGQEFVFGITRRTPGELGFKK